MGRYSRGHKTREGAARPLPFSLSHHGRLHAIELPDEVDLTPHVPFVVDQDGTGTCFACAPAVAIKTTLRAAGQDLPFHISILDLATLVHAIERAADGRGLDAPLYDWGGDPRDVVTAISKWGVRQARYRLGTSEASRFCDASPDTVGPAMFFPGVDKPGVEPNLADITRDAETLLVGAHEVTSLTECRQALADGVALTIAWCATDADEDVGPDTILDGRDGEANHDTMIIGVKRRPDGSSIWRMQNSWGPWADGGRIWVNDSFMRSATAIYSMDVRMVVS